MLHFYLYVKFNIILMIQILIVCILNIIVELHNVAYTIGVFFSIFHDTSFV